jgi:carboxymethylenebutenolidase
MMSGLLDSVGRMCYDADAAPPFYGEPITTVSSMPLMLTSADGARFAAFLAQPATPSGVGLLVLPDNRGLSRFYEEISVRLAEQGHTAIAIDYFARTAGLDHHDRAWAAMADLMPHLQALTRDGLYGDWTAAIGHLRVVGCRAVVSLGFCMGGRFAFLSAAARFGLAGAIGLYGWPGPLNGAPGPTQLALAGQLAAPILGMFGGGDEGIPPSVVAEFDDALTAARVSHEIVTYPGAPHGFFELSSDEFASASADVWRRVLAFVSAI